MWWLPFSRWHFQMHFLEWKCMYFFYDFARALGGQEVRPLGPWKSNGALVKSCLRAQWTPQNWRIGNVFQWRDPTKFAWVPWKFKRLGPREPCFSEVCSLGSNQQYSIISSDNGLDLIRWQAIIWTNNGLVYWCIYASLGLNELNRCPIAKLHWYLSHMNVIFCRLASFLLSW